VKLHLHVVLICRSLAGREHTQDGYGKENDEPSHD